MQCTNWALKPHIGSEVNLLTSHFPVQRSVVTYIWNNSYLYCGCRCLWKVINRHFLREYPRRLLLADILAEWTVNHYITTTTVILKECIMYSTTINLSLLNFITVSLESDIMICNPLLETLVTFGAAEIIYWKFVLKIKKMTSPPEDIKSSGWACPRPPA